MSTVAKNYKISANTSDGGLAKLADLKKAVNLGWDELILGAIAKVYKLDINDLMLVRVGKDGLTSGERKAQRAEAKAAKAAEKAQAKADAKAKKAAEKKAGTKKGAKKATKKATKKAPEPEPKPEPTPEEPETQVVDKPKRSHHKKTS